MRVTPTRVGHPDYRSCHFSCQRARAVARGPEPVATRALSCQCSEQQLQTELANAWIVGIRDYPKYGAVDIAAWRLKLRMVEDIEELRPKLQPHTFRKFRVLE